MKTVLAGKEPVPFRIPPGINLIKINAKTGQRSQSDKNVILEAFKPGTNPPSEMSAIGVQSGTGYWTSPETGGLY